MGKQRFLLALMLMGAAAAPGGAQMGQSATGDNPAHAPSVFLGGPKTKKDKAPTSRALKGSVTDDSGKPLAGALVTLTDTKKYEKWTFITKKDGRYNFDDLSFTIDYELVARYKDLQSETRKLSQYDHTASVVRILEVTQPVATPSNQPSQQSQAKSR